MFLARVERLSWTGTSVSAEAGLVDVESEAVWAEVVSVEVASVWAEVVSAEVASVWAVGNNGWPGADGDV